MKIIIKFYFDYKISDPFYFEIIEKVIKYACMQI